MDHVDDGGAASTPAASLPAADGPPEWREPAERLHRRVVAYWYLTDVLRAGIVTAVLLAGAWFVGRDEPRKARWLEVGAWCLGGAVAALALVMPPLQYARWRYGIDDDLMVMRYGVIFVEERLVPVRRMQHVDLTRGPVERLFGLATLVVFTAGNEGSAFRVPGLGGARAEALRDRILRARGHDGL